MGGDFFFIVPEIGNMPHCVEIIFDWPLMWKFDLRKMNVI